MSDLNRRGSRRKIESSGKISLGILRRLSCSVLDVSNSGARILVDEQQSLPGSFWIRISGLPRKRKAELRWRDGEQVGLEFI